MVFWTMYFNSCNFEIWIVIFKFKIRKINAISYKNGYPATMLAFRSTIGSCVGVPGYFKFFLSFMIPCFLNMTQTDPDRVFLILITSHPTWVRASFFLSRNLIGQSQVKLEMKPSRFSNFWLMCLELFLVCVRLSVRFRNLWALFFQRIIV